jgi:peptidyl-prolyl cis-trans isomerase SurA
MADLDNRLRLIIATSGMPDTPEMRHNMMYPVLRGLIDERLQLAEIKRAGINIPQEAIEEAFETLERRNNKPAGSLMEFLQTHRIPRQTMEDQARSQIGWMELVRAHFANTVTISEREIDLEIDRLAQQTNKTVYLLSEIFLAFDGPDEDRVMRHAESLCQALMQQEVSFPALASQLSQSASAATGGDIGWITADALDPDLREAVEQAPPGSLLHPIRTNRGVYIIAIRGREVQQPPTPEETMEIKHVRTQAARPLSRQNIDTAMAKIEKLRIRTHSCPALVDFARTVPNVKIRDIKDITLEQLPPQVAELLSDTPINQLTPSVLEDDWAIAFMICQRHTPTAEEYQRQQVEERLRRDKLTQASARLLRDLRRQAYIDIRV